MVKISTKQFFFLSFILLSTILSLIECQQDYYKTLGVPKNADDTQIKKAFKKLSLKYHPDKNKDNEEHAKQQFVKVAQAYETLIDPEKRKIYDQYGEEGVKRKDAGGDPSGNFGGGGGFSGDFQDIFSSFFGGGGGFNFGGGGGRRQQQQKGGSHQQRFTFNMGGGGQQQGRQQGRQQGHHGFEEEQEAKPGLWEQSDVIQIKMDNIASFYRRIEVWVVLFYKSNDAKIKTYETVLKEIAEKLYGIVKVAAINCDEDAEEALCEDFSVYGVPKILVFPANSRVEPLTYTGEIQYGPIASFAVNQMETFVKLVTENNYESFIREDFDKSKVILFTSKKSTPPLFKALSKEFKGRLVLGEIRESSESLVKKFGITSFPTILALSDSDNYSGTKYEGEFKKDQIAKFLREHAAAVNKRPNRGASADLKELTPYLMRSGPCSPNDSNMCLLVILNHEESRQSNRVKEMFRDIAPKYANDPIAFHFIWAPNIDYASSFDGVSSFPSVFVIKTKRGRYTKYEGEINSENLQTFVDSVLSGSAAFKNMRSELTLLTNRYDDEL